jgi:hypothetical protein
MVRQRSRVDTAKVVSTFAAGIAGALVASALQTGNAPSGWEWAAAWGLAATVLLTLLVMVFDRLVEPDHHQVLHAASFAGWSDAEKLLELRKAALAASKYNEGVVALVRGAQWLQLPLAVFTGFAAAYSMLHGQGNL